MKLAVSLQSVYAALVLASSVVCLGQASSGPLVPFAMDHRRGALEKSPVDVSFLLDAPAGKHGLLRASGGHIVDADGKRVRLWGVNLTEWSKGSTMIPSKQDAPLWAGTLARFGVNCVRLQFLDLPTPRGLLDGSHGDSRTFDAQALDREDYFLAELEKRGIYIDINLLVGRPFKSGDGVNDASLLGQGAKGTSLYDKRLIELQKEYAKQLLGHRNPYTTRTYAEDPAVAIVEINNENAIDVGYHAPSPFYASELNTIYNRWLATHATPEQLGVLHQQAHLDPPAPLPLMQSYNDFDNTPNARFYAEANFYNDLQQAYYADMQTYLRQTVGVKAIILGTADHHHADSGYPVLLANSGFNIVDGHDYWQHPEVQTRRSAMVDDPFNSLVAELSRSAVLGKPYTVSETNEPFPNDYAGEGIPILAAYAALQDWDAILWYTFEPKAAADWKPYVGDPFDISLDPVKMPELAAGALLFLRGDVGKSRSLDVRSYTKKQVFDSMLLPRADRPYFTPGWPPQLPFEHEVRIGSLAGKPTELAPPVSASPLVADTRELAWYGPGKESGLVTVDAPRVQSLIGFVGAHDVSLTHLKAGLDNRFASLMLSSLDQQPVANSERLLLVAGSTVRNTGQQWNSAGSDVSTWGGAPSLIEPVKGTVSLLSLATAKAVSVQPLDGAGQPLGTAIEATEKGDGTWSFPMGSPVTTWYVIHVAR